MVRIAKTKDKISSKNEIKGLVIPPVVKEEVPLTTPPNKELNVAAPPPLIKANPQDKNAESFTPKTDTVITVPAIAANGTDKPLKKLSTTGT